MTLKGNDSNHLKVIPSGITATIKEYKYLLYMIDVAVLANGRLLNRTLHIVFLYILLALNYA